MCVCLCVGVCVGVCVYVCVCLCVGVCMWVCQCGWVWVGSINIRLRAITHQLYSVPILVHLLWFVVSTLHLHGLERFREVATLSEVFGPLSYVGLQ